MIHITMTEKPGGDAVGFQVKFDGAADAEAAMRGEEVQVALTPAVPLDSKTRSFLSGLIGSAAREYVAGNAH